MKTQIVSKPLFSAFNVRLNEMLHMEMLERKYAQELTNLKKKKFERVETRKESGILMNFFREIKNS
jgi:hypothetical protein